MDRPTPATSPWMAPIAVSAAIVGFVLLGLVVVKTSKPDRRVDYEAMCARHGLTFQRHRSLEVCVGKDGRLFQFDLFTRDDATIYRN